jgi:hypothetical protein
MLVRRSSGDPLDIHLVRTRGHAASSVTDVAGAVADPVRRWHVDGGRVSQLAPGFPIGTAVHTQGVEVVSSDDGSVIATGADGDVVVYGMDGQVGIYRMH